MEKKTRVNGKGEGCSSESGCAVGLGQGSRKAKERAEEKKNEEETGPDGW